MEDENTYYVLGGPDSEEQCTIEYNKSSRPFNSYCIFDLKDGSRSVRIRMYDVHELDRMIERLTEVKEKMERDR